MKNKKEDELESVIQAPPGRELVVSYPITSSSEDIAQREIQRLRDLGYEVEPDTLEHIKWAVKDTQKGKAGHKIGVNLSLPLQSDGSLPSLGGGGSYEITPQDKTAEQVGGQIRITYTIRKKD